MFRGYRFEHPRNETVVEVGGWSYLWAGLFGAFYIWRLGFGRLFPRAFAINLLYGLLFVGFFLVTLSVIRSGLQWYALQVIAIPILIVSQGNTMVQMIRDAYRHRGWMIRQR